jgi:hypothetical protein
MLKQFANIGFGTFVAMVWIFSAVCPGIDSAAPVEKLPQFRITTKRDNDNVKIQVDRNRTIFAVRSPFGIGQATIERIDDRWPNEVLLRMHLTGLECVRISTSKLTLATAVSSHDDEQQIHLSTGGKGVASLDAKSPCWMPIRLIGADGKPSKTIPLEGGYFEMTLPEPLFEGNPKSMTLDWIDFHR